MKGKVGEREGRWKGRGRPSGFAPPCPEKFPSYATGGICVCIYSQRSGTLEPCLESWSYCGGEPVVIINKYADTVLWINPQTN